MGLPRATAYRHLKPKTERPKAPAPKRPESKRRIPDEERGRILGVLDSDEFIDQPPREVYGALLSRGIYLCSVRSMYRILAERGPVRERRNQRPARRFSVPRLVAEQPNQVWTWDISKLATTTPGEFLNLYVVLDLFSRFVVAWMIAKRENSALAKQLFVEAIARHGVTPGQLLVHMDRGAPMTAHGFQDMLAEMGVDRSHSRPRVSNDNAFSESHFRTFKYQPDYPGRFRDIRHARSWSAQYFQWYNEEHQHEGLALFTPRAVFSGQVSQVAQVRQSALLEAYRRHPERFINGPPKLRLPPQQVFLNPDDHQATLAGDVVLSLSDDELHERLLPKQTSGPPLLIDVPGATPDISFATSN